MIEGTLKTTKLNATRLTVEITGAGLIIKALVSISSQNNGAAVWYRTNDGTRWSDKTREAIDRAISCVEADIAAVLMGAPADNESKDEQPDGLLEFLAGPAEEL